MSVGRLYRWSGIGLLLGGLLSLASSTVSGIVHPGTDYTPQQILSAPWAAGEIVLFVGLLFIAISFPACYVPQAPRAGRLGFTGFVMLWVGLLLTVCFAAARLAFWPYLAQSAPQLLPSGNAGPVAGALLFIFGPMLLMTLGGIFLGAATLRAGVFPRGVGILLIVWSALNIAGLFLPSAVGDLLDPVGDAAFFLALAWSGLVVVTQRQDVEGGIGPAAAQVEAAR